MGLARRGHGQRHQLRGLAGIGGPRVDALVPKIKTGQQAHAVFDTADRHLAGARALVPQLPRFTGLREATLSHIDTVQRFIVRSRPKIPTSGAITPDQARFAALSVVQAEDVLKEVDANANDPELKFWPNFQQAIRGIVGGGVNLVVGGVALPALEGLGWKVIAPVAAVAGVALAVSVWRRK